MHFYNYLKIISTIDHNTYKSLMKCLHCKQYNLVSLKVLCGSIVFSIYINDMVDF